MYFCNRRNLWVSRAAAVGALSVGAFGLSQTSAFAQTTPTDNMPSSDYDVGMPPAAMATRTSTAMGPYLGVVFVLALAVGLFAYAKRSFVGMAAKRK